MTTCESAVLVEAAFDERLGVSERASLDRHLTACATCTKLLADLTTTRDTLRAPREEIAPLAHQRARLALLRASASPDPRPNARRPLAFVAAALVLVPALVFAAASYSSSRGGAPTPSVPSSAPTLEPSHPAPLSTTPNAPSDELPVPTPDPSSTKLVASAPSASSTHPKHVEAPSAASSSSSSSPASRAFAEAMDAISRGDFGAGAAMLDRFATTYPADARVEEAVYLRAIAFERAGRKAEARVAARSYLGRYPAGAHRTQAERIAGE